MKTLKDFLSESYVDVISDEVIDNSVTASKYSYTNTVRVFEGGSHRFDHMKEALDDIELYMNLSNVSSGFGDN